MQRGVDRRFARGDAVFNGVFRPSRIIDAARVDIGLLALFRGIRKDHVVNGSARRYYSKRLALEVKNNKHTRLCVQYVGCMYLFGNSDTSL